MRTRTTSFHLGAACGLVVALGMLASPAPSQAVISISAGPSGDGAIINTLVGADTFYNYGFFGQWAVIANIEGGAVWNGHESTSHITTYLHNPTLSGTQLGQFDYHATAVGMTLAGRGQYYYYQAGIAPMATLWSGSIATKFNSDGSFETTDASFTYPYVQAMLVPREVTVPFFGGSLTFNKTADVVNSSWGFEDPSGKAFETVFTDALVAKSRVTFVAAAGNSGPAANTVGGPASGYNKIAVGALTADLTNNPYTLPASFSSRGMNDFYNPRTGRVYAGVRPVVDIAAPGDELVLAYYGGTTGGNTGGTDESNGAIDWYWTNAAGTSFAAPTVAGGAALLADVGNYAFGGNSTDARVIKVVLLNSADKTPGWNNAQYRYGDGVVRTRQGLDLNVGAGRMNLTRAIEQYAFGNVDAGSGGYVLPEGWALGHVAQPVPNDYKLEQMVLAGDSITATLNWFVHRAYTDPTATTTSPGDGSQGGTVTDDRFDNLDLQIWKVIDGEPAQLVAESSTLYNNTEHLNYIVPETGYYLIRVLWNGRVYDIEGAGVTRPVSPMEEDYALAWYVPEPGAMLGITAMLIVLGRRARRVARIP